MAKPDKLLRIVQAACQPEEGASGPDTKPYRPPFRQVLALLGLTESSLQAQTVTIPVSALLCLFSQVLADAEVDEAWYLDRYPDVHAAILAGRTPSASAHFRLSGYREGRLPGPLPFDPEFYFDTYKDLAAAFDRTDARGLQHHYETRGYLEGRAGVRSHLLPAESWAKG